LGVAAGDGNRDGRFGRENKSHDEFYSIEKGLITRRPGGA
jgi:hypothetical protein